MGEPGKPDHKPPVLRAISLEPQSYLTFLLKATGIIFAFVVTLKCAFYFLMIPSTHQEFIGEWIPWRHRPSTLGNTYPRILLWTPAKDNDWPPTEQRMLMECMTRPERKPCYITKYDVFLAASDAIIFDASRIDPYKLPRRRHPDQVWVFSTLEGAPKPPSIAFRAISHLFNWTMSLRQDADVVVSYKNFTAYDDERSVPIFWLTDLVLLKPKTAVVFVSECEEPLRNNTNGKEVRFMPNSTENYFKHINHTLDVYMFSDCGRPFCNTRTECMMLAAREYYFVFVLESSPCFDHPLEIIYESFEWDVVPVYFGQTSIENVVPPGSVYDTTKEDSAFAIVDKLNLLRYNVTEYLPYLTWKEVYYPKEPEDPLCALCDALYQTPEAHSSHYNNVMEWWDHRQNCGYVYPSPGLPMTVVEFTEDGAHVVPDEIADIPGRIRRTGSATERQVREML